MNRKPLFLTITTLALLVIGGAFCFMQKRQVAVNQPVVEVPVRTEPENFVDTSDWKTYRNEAYGIRFKYPASRGWALEEFDYSSDSSLPYYPERGVRVLYNFASLNTGVKDGGSEQLTFRFNDSRWGGANIHLRNPSDSNVYTFAFHGQQAIAVKPWNGEKDRDAVYNFFNEQKCTGTIVFGIPELPKPWESNETVTLLCGSPDAPSENVELFRTILDSVNFFN